MPFEICPAIWNVQMLKSSHMNRILVSKIVNVEHIHVFGQMKIKGVI